MRRIIGAGLGVWLIACGSDAGETPPLPERRCREFAELWCERSIGCLVEVGTVPPGEEGSTLDVCVGVAEAAARCEDVVAVEPAFNECLMAISDMQCSQWAVPESELDQVTPPPICQGVLLVQ